MKHKIVSSHSNAPDIETATSQYMDRFNGPVGEWMLSLQATGTRQLLPDAPSRVLDVGGGHGQNIPTLQGCEHQITVLGSDESPTSLIQSYIDTGTVEYRAGSLIDMPFTENNFDAVISYRTVCHMDDLDAFISELTRVARDAVIIDFPSSASFNILYAWLFKLKKRIESNTREYHLFSQNEINEQFARHDFILEDQFKQFFLPMALHRFIGVRPLSIIFEKLFRLTGVTWLLGSPVLARYRPRHGTSGLSMG